MSDLGYVKDGEGVWRPAVPSDFSFTQDLLKARREAQRERIHLERELIQDEQENHDG